jgi:D-3-phosphoglycerate dehydrogenase
MNFGILDVVPKQLEILNQLEEYGNVIHLGNVEKKELLKLVPDFDILLIRIYKVDEEILSASSKLKAVIKAGIGVDHIDVKAATGRKIHVVISPGNHFSVGETTVMLMLAVARQLSIKNKNVDENLQLLGKELYGKRLGLVGFGRIGKHTAQIAGDGLGMEIVIYDPYIKESAKKDVKWTFVHDLDTLLKTSDVVSIHCPLDDNTRHMIDKQRLEMMKEDAILVNTARGAVIDENALFEALKNGKLFGAGLDVVEVEPLDAGNPLLALENVIVSPHRLVQTPESIIRQANSMLASSITFSKGQIPLESINSGEF